MSLVNGTMQGSISDGSADQPNSDKSISFCISLVSIHKISHPLVVLGTAFIHALAVHRKDAYFLCIGLCPPVV